jgi:hypothetical protein
MAARKRGEVKNLDQKGANLSQSIATGLMSKIPMRMVMGIIVPSASILNISVLMMEEQSTTKSDDTDTMIMPVVVDHRTLTFRTIVLRTSGMFARTTTMSLVEWLLLKIRQATILERHFRIEVRRRLRHSKIQRPR